jgi:hypothetical protein
VSSNLPSPKSDQQDVSDRPKARSRRSNRALPLVLATTASLTACGNHEPEVTLVQDQYQTLEDCKKDWGDESAACLPTDTESSAPSTSSSFNGSGGGHSGGGSSGGGYYYGDRTYYGPLYQAGRREYTQNEILQRNGRSLSASGGYSDHAINRNTFVSNGKRSHSSSTFSSNSYRPNSISRAGFGSSARGSGGG